MFSEVLSSYLGDNVGGQVLKRALGPEVWENVAQRNLRKVTLALKRIESLEPQP